MSEERWTPPDPGPVSDARMYRGTSWSLAAVSLLCWLGYIQGWGPSDTTFHYVRLWLAVAVVATVFSGVAAVVSGLHGWVERLAEKQSSRP